jgi:hypothetical protein
MKVIQSIVLALALGMTSVVARKGSRGSKGSSSIPSVDGLYETIDPSDGGVFKVIISGTNVFFTETITSLCLTTPALGSFGSGTITSLTSMGLTADLTLECGDGSFTTPVPFTLAGTFGGDGIILATLPSQPTSTDVVFFKIGPRLKNERTCDSDVFGLDTLAFRFRASPDNEGVTTAGRSSVVC